MRKRILARETPPRSEDEGCPACIVSPYRKHDSDVKRHKNTASCKKTRDILAQIDPDPRRAHHLIRQAAQQKRLLTDSNVKPTMSKEKRQISVNGQKIPITTGDGVSIGKVQNDSDEDECKDDNGEGDDDNEFEDDEGDGGEGDDDDEWMP